MKLKKWLSINRSVFAERDLDFLLKVILAKSNPLVLEVDSCLDRRTLIRLNEAKRLYLRGIPLAYILGKEEFFGYEFDVNSHVLIPRPETELIVEKALEIINSKKLRLVLDLCSGSGNIAVSLKKASLRDLSIFASDYSREALKVAELNARKHKANIKFIQTDLLAGFKLGSFDLIVSNPPYVENEAIKGTLKYEPWSALSGGEDGLDIVKRILKQAKSCLKKEGYLIMEIGHRHKAAINQYVENDFKPFPNRKYELVEWIKDYSGHFRGVILKSNG